MKRILYDMCPLTLVRWLLQRACKFKPPFGKGSKLKKVPPPKVEFPTYFCQTPVLDLGLGVDFVFPLSQEQETQEEPSPKSTRREETIGL